MLPRGVIPVKADICGGLSASRPQQALDPCLVPPVVGGGGPWLGDAELPA